MKATTCYLKGLSLLVKISSRTSTTFPFMEMCGKNFRKHLHTSLKQRTTRHAYEYNKTITHIRYKVHNSKHVMAPSLYHKLRH